MLGTDSENSSNMAKFIIRSPKMNKGINFKR